MHSSTFRLLITSALAATAFACTAGQGAPVATTATSEAGSGTVAADTVPTDAPPAAPTSQPSSMPAEPAAATPEPAHPTIADALADGASGHYGAPFSSEAAPIPLNLALTQCADTGSPCKVEGVIESVCQARGCWFTLSAPDVAPTVRVRMLNYGFLVPRNVSGATVVLEGTLARTVIPSELAQHYADDEAAAGTAPARQVAGPEDTYEFTITGATITRM